MQIHVSTSARAPLLPAHQTSQATQAHQADPSGRAVPTKPAVAPASDGGSSPARGHGRSAAVQLPPTAAEPARMATSAGNTAKAVSRLEHFSRQAQASMSKRGGTQSHPTARRDVATPPLTDTSTTATKGARPVTTDAAGPAADQPATGGGPTLTVEELMKAWGTDDATYDLNGDGIVNVHDLLNLMSRLGSGTVDGEPAPGGHPLTLDGLMSAWGTDDPSYDLNSDGVVDVHDLLEFINHQNANGGNQPPSDQPTLDGLLAAWGSGDAMYDLNGDGTVDVADLLQFLEQQSEG